MKIEAKSVDEYINKCPEDRQEALKKLRQAILDNLPKGFEEQMNYNMPGYVVPHSLYAPGYHCDPKLPLPFANFASQKNFIAFYHMGIYAEKELLDWFVAEYPKYSSKKLDMGKSCIRFKKPDDIPFELIGELMAKFTPQEWVELYEKNYKR